MDQDHVISSVSSPSSASCTRSTRLATESSDDVCPCSRELAFRASNGTQVRLLWRHGTRQLWVEVMEPATAWALTIQAQPENALDVFHHPYAYAGLQNSLPPAESFSICERSPQPVDEKRHGQ
jgi:hypothetical protein